MKKTLIISNVCWILLFSAFLFKNCVPESGECKDLSKSYEKDLFVGFPGKTAKTMSQLYQEGNKRNVIKNGEVSTEDVRSVWFSMDSLKKFIWNIEKATCEVKQGELSDLGVRIYFSRYPTDPKEILRLPGFEKLTEKEAMDLAGRHSLFMVPTLKDEEGDSDYDAMREWRLKRERMSGKNTAPKSSFFAVQRDFESAFNHATLCPVACGGGTSF